MSLSKKDIAILILGPTSFPDFSAALEQDGFGTVADQGNRTAREALTALLDAGAEGVVTVAPGDGFSVEDVVRTADLLMHAPDKLCVGLPADPPGQQNTAERLYSFLSGITPSAGQTSLFGMSARTARIMTQMKSAEDTFVYNIPLEARAKGIEMADLPTGVHAPAPDMHLITRSFKLYTVFLKFSLAAMIAYIVDIGTFGLFEVVFGFLSDEYKILVATILSRVLCSIATYILNRSAVFPSQSKQQGSGVRFIILSVVQLIASWLLVWGLGVLLNANDFVNMLLKIIVDLVIFLASFTIMRDWVFRKSEDKVA